MRSQEDHVSLAELERLPVAGEHVEDTDAEWMRQVQLHIAQCAACSELVAGYASLHQLAAIRADAETGNDCPPEDVWLQIAAEILRRDTDAMLAHAAACRRCADALREAVAMMQPSLEDEEILQGLASSTPEWQQQMAAQMASATKKTPLEIVSRHAKPSGRSFQRSTWVALATAAALALLAISGLFLWRALHPSDERLLATAYNKHRLLMLRIPGSDPVPFYSGTRGTTADASEPAELLQLRLRTKEHLDETPNSPYWHQVLGRINLLEGDGLAARRNFEIAQVGDSNLPQIQTDLADAWFQVGEQTNNPVAYSEAADIYSRELQRGEAKNLSLLYYNRAQCWKRLNLTENAVKDLKAALEKEQSAAWRKNIEDEIAALEKKLSYSNTTGYEASVARSMTQIAEWNTSEKVRSSITQTSAEGIAHNDHWLQDWIAAPHSAISRQADEALVSALHYASTGQAALSLEDADRAATLYRKEKHVPGELRALQAELFAYQRLGKAKECIETAQAILKEPASSRYGLTRTQTLLDKGACEARIGQFDQARLEFQEAQRTAEADHLPSSALYAASAMAENLQAIGLLSTSWAKDVDCLALCEQSGCSAGRRYSILYDMGISAQELKLSYVAVQLMETAEALSAKTGNAMTHAFALETLATFAGRIGDYSQSMHAFDRAFQLIPPGKDTPEARLYRALWQIDQAEILTRKGEPSASLHLLQQSFPAIRGTDYQPGRLNYYIQLANAEWKSGENDAALADMKQAENELEISLASVKSVAERDQWARHNADVYGMLASLYQKEGKPAEALHTWERFRGLPYIEQEKLRPSLIQGHSDAPRVLVLAHLQEEYVGWLIDPFTMQIVHTARLGESDALHSLVSTFYRLCSDKSSNIVDVRSAGKRVYERLLYPFQDSLRASNQLWLELDPSLNILPVSALVTPDEKFLGDTSQIFVLSPWWSLHPAASFARPKIDVSMRMIVLNGWPSIQMARSEEDEMKHLFPHTRLLDGGQQAQEALLKTISDAEMLHFSGHASSINGSRLLFASAGNTAMAVNAEKLSTVRLPGCRLAVLAACNTTAADPDRIDRLPDLRNALLLSGSQNVIASNWDVDDQSTHALMATLYRRLLDGAEPAYALQIAQQSIRNTAEWQHPYYWASFENFTL